MPQNNLRTKLWRNGYWYIEVKPKHWTMMSRYLVETTLGIKLSPKEEVLYKDGNTKNCVLSNLIVKDFPRRLEWWFDEVGNKVIRDTALWCRKYHQCRKCSTNVKPHKGLGLCTSCYYLDYWGKL